MLEQLKKVLLEVREQMKSTVIAYPERDPEGIKWGDPKYNGNCSGKVPLGFIDKLGAHSVSELFAGSGTLSDVCRDFKIPYCGIDLNPTPKREDIISMDILDTSQELPDAFYEADMCFSHPPYPGINHVRYSGKEWADPSGELSKHDIQNMPFEKGMRMINISTMRAYSALPAGSYMVILVGEIRSNGEYHSMFQNLALPGEVYQTYVKMQYNTWSGRQNRNYSNSKRALTNHEMIVVLKKPSGYEIAYVVPHKVAVDIRDSTSATWKDIVFTVLREIGRESGQNASLDKIYGSIAGHKRAEQNPHWKEKVRQCLQMLKKDGKVKSSSRGNYCVA